MRPLSFAISMLLAGAAVQAATPYPNRLPHGSVVDAPVAKRASVEADESTFEFDRPLAQNTAAPGTVEPPPPPGIDDPGGNTVTLDEAMPEAGEKVLPRERSEDEVPADERPQTTAPDADAPLPPKVQSPDAISPAVTIRREGDYTIEEYRRDGQIYMVVVIPQQGPRQTYLDTDGNGRLESDIEGSAVQPVYYTLYEWD